MALGATNPLDTEVRYADGESVTTSLRQLDLKRASTALPVRRLKSHVRQRHYSGLFWSATTGAHVPYESRLELDRLWLADFDADVHWIAAQPMWFGGSDEGVLRRHAPDLLLTDRRGVMTVVDVKPAEFVDRTSVPGQRRPVRGMVRRRPGHPGEHPDVRRRPPRCWNGRAGGRLRCRTHGHDHRSGRGPPGSFGKAWRAACPAELAVARRLGGGHDHACRQHVDDQCQGRQDMSAAVVELYVGARVWFRTRLDVLANVRNARHSHNRGGLRLGVRMGPRRSRGRRFAVVTATVALAVGLGACAGSDPAPGTTGEGAAVTDRPVEHSTLGCDQWEGSDIVVAGDGGAATGPGAAEDPAQAIRNFATLEGLPAGKDSEVSAGVWVRVGADGRASHILRLARSGKWWYVSGLDKCAPAHETPPN